MLLGSLLREINTKGKMRNDGGEGSVQPLCWKAVSPAGIIQPFCFQLTFWGWKIAAETFKPDLEHWQSNAGRVQHFWGKDEVGLQYICMARVVRMIIWTTIYVKGGPQDFCLLCVVWMMIWVAMWLVWWLAQVGLGWPAQHICLSVASLTLVRTLIPRYLISTLSEFAA